MSSGPAGVRWVPVAALRPQRCLFIPYIGANHRKGFLTTNTSVDEWNHAYCSVEAAEQFARFMNWAAPDELESEQAKTAAALERVTELEAERDELLAFKAQFVALTDAGAEIKRRPGRPRKAPADKAAA